MSVSILKNKHETRRRFNQLHYFFNWYSNFEVSIEWSVAEEARVETSRLICILSEYRSICSRVIYADHPRHVFVNIVHHSLAHALRYSSTFEAFDHERRYIKLMLLYNGWVSRIFVNIYAQISMGCSSPSFSVPRFLDIHPHSSKKNFENSSMINCLLRHSYHSFRTKNTSLSCVENFSLKRSHNCW